MHGCKRGAAAAAAQPCQGASMHTNRHGSRAATQQREQPQPCSGGSSTTAAGQQGSNARLQAESSCGCSAAAARSQGHSMQTHRNSSRAATQHRSCSTLAKQGSHTAGEHLCEQTSHTHACSRHRSRQRWCLGKLAGATLQACCSSPSYLDAHSSATVCRQLSQLQLAHSSASQTCRRHSGSLQDRFLFLCSVGDCQRSTLQRSHALSEDAA